VDAHAHVGPWYNFFTPEPTADSMVRVMDRCGVGLAVVSATRAISGEAEAGNAEVAEMIRRHPGRFAGYAVFNPHVPHSLANVEAALAEPGFVGIKIHPDVQAYAVDGPLYAPVFELAARRGVPILTHTFVDSAFSDPLMFDAIAARWPSVVIMLGHAGVTGEGHRRALAVAAKRPNLYLELCGSFTTGLWVRRMVAALGAERVLYGSDFPFIELRYGLGRVVFAGLAEEDLALVLGGNARRVLKLSLYA
jgi:predicted TIM-barrel fold metal-dependent hydrolase